MAPWWSRSLFVTLLQLTLFLFLVTGVKSQTVQCYRCNDAYRNYATPCSSFESSKKFVVDCPNSTMCSKVTHEMPIVGGTAKIIARDCASPHHDYWDFFKNGEVGCKLTNDILNATVCLCKRNLCNSAPSIRKASYHNMYTIMAVIFAFNAMKYI